MKLSTIVVVIYFAVFLFYPTSAQEPTNKLLIPMGGGYSDINTGFTSVVIENAIDYEQSEVNILVVPINYAPASDQITSAGRSNLMDLAESRRILIEESCNWSAPPEMTCDVNLAPVFSRGDVDNIKVNDFFPPGLNGIIILEGDQKSGIRIIEGTEFEQALEKSYSEGVIIAGTEAGTNLLSTAMIGGFTTGYMNENSLQFGTVEMWMPPERGGLSLGVNNAVLDHEIFQGNHLGRLINAIALPDAPHIGIGVDGFSGVHIRNGERIDSAFGLYTTTILDAQTYHSADAVSYSGSDYILSLRNIVVHLLSPGNFTYNLISREHNLGAPPPRINRQFDAFSLPLGAGPIILGGNLSNSLAGNPILTHFVNISGGEKSNIAIIASGYPSQESAVNAIEQFKSAINVPIQSWIVSQNDPTPLELPNDLTGIILIGEDQSKINPENLLAVKNLWINGVPLLADNAGASLIGKYYSTNGPTPQDSKGAEIATQRSFYLGETQIAPGLGLLNAAIEPRLLSDNRWGRFFSLGYAHPELLTIGLNDDVAIRIATESATVLGKNAVLTLDLSHAVLDVGENRGFVIANGLLDVFAPGDVVEPNPAEMDAAPILAATPDLSTPTFTSTPTASPTLTSTSMPTFTIPSPTTTNTPITIPTRARKPTPTLPAIPPPADPGRANLMITFGILGVIVVMIGMWINRHRIN